MAKIVVPTPNTVITSAWGTSVADALNRDLELGYGNAFLRLLRQPYKRTSKCSMQPPRKVKGPATNPPPCLRRLTLRADYPFLFA